MPTYMIIIMFFLGLAAVGLGFYTLVVAFASVYWGMTWQHYVMAVIGFLVFIIGLIIIIIPMMELIL